MWYLFLIALCIVNNSFSVQEEPCSNERSCIDRNNHCQCYCAIKCGFRDKTGKDKPVYKPDDQYHKHCYCNKDDYEMVDEGKCLEQ